MNHGQNQGISLHDLFVVYLIKTNFSRAFGAHILSLEYTREILKLWFHVCESNFSTLYFFLLEFDSNLT